MERENSWLRSKTIDWRGGMDDSGMKPRRKRGIGWRVEWMAKE
jgi:hypothetical protein